MSQTTLWIIVGVVVVILVMVLAAVWPERQSLQVRVERGIGSSAQDDIAD